MKLLIKQTREEEKNEYVFKQRQLKDFMREQKMKQQFQQQLNQIQNQIDNSNDKLFQVRQAIQEEETAIQKQKMQKQWLRMQLRDYY